MKNCRQHTMSAAKASQDICKNSLEGCFTMKLTACPITMNNDTAHIQNELDWCPDINLWALGIKYLSAMAVANGSNSNGMTSLHICEKEFMKSISPPRIIESKDGAVNATVMLHNSEYLAILVMFPPSMPVITGAAVAVGMKKQMNAPAATSGLK